MNTANSLHDFQIGDGARIMLAARYSRINTQHRYLYFVAVPFLLATIVIIGFLYITL